MPGGEYEELFYKQKISRKLRNWIRAGAFWAYFSAAVTAVTALLVFPLMLLDAMLMLGLGVGIQIFRNRACSVILLVYYWINRLIIWLVDAPSLLSVIICLLVSAVLFMNVRAVFLYHEKLQRYIEFIEARDAETDI